MKKKSYLINIGDKIYYKFSYFL